MLLFLLSLLEVQKRIYIVNLIYLHLIRKNIFLNRDLPELVHVCSLYRTR